MSTANPSCFPKRRNDIISLDQAKLTWLGFDLWQEGGALIWTILEFLISIWHSSQRKDQINVLVALGHLL